MASLLKSIDEHYTESEANDILVVVEGPVTEDTIKTFIAYPKNNPVKYTTIRGSSTIACNKVAAESNCPESRLTSGASSLDDVVNRPESGPRGDAPTKDNAPEPRGEALAPTKFENKANEGLAYKNTKTTGNIPNHKGNFASTKRVENMAAENNKQLLDTPCSVPLGPTPGPLVRCSVDPRVPHQIYREHPATPRKAI